MAGGTGSRYRDSLAVPQSYISLARTIFSPSGKVTILAAGAQIRELARVENAFM